LNLNRSVTHGTGVVYQDANIKVTAVENSHFAFHSGINAGKYKSYAYRFEMSDRVIVFTGDTGPSDAVTELAKGADLLVTEAASFQDRMQRMIDNGRWQSMTPAEQARVTGQATRDITLEDIGKMAERANVRTVVLSHLSARADGSDDYTPWAAEVKTYFSGRVLVANSNGILTPLFNSDQTRAKAASDRYGQHLAAIGGAADMPLT
jgi:ribonuclease BN (tRNA processing enzyme)